MDEPIVLNSITERVLLRNPAPAEAEAPAQADGQAHEEQPVRTHEAQPAVVRMLWS